MRLADLDTTFIRVRMEPAPDCIGRKLEDGSTQWGGFPSAVIHDVPHRLGAHGLRFTCPTCGDKDGHKIQVFFRGEDVPGGLGRNMRGDEVRWDATGQFLDDLTLSPSIHAMPCNMHIWIMDGEVKDA